MKNFFNVVACLLIVTVAAFVCEAFGLVKLPLLDAAAQRGTAAVTWAKGGFKGSVSEAMAATNPTVPAPETVKADTPKKAEAARLIAESKQRALAKYPDIAVANTEMNSRFVFRYNWLAKENSPRLQEPNWPETLADECASAAKVHAKTGSGPTPASSKKLVASSTR